MENQDVVGDAEAAPSASEIIEAVEEDAGATGGKPGRVDPLHASDPNNR